MNLLLDTHTFLWFSVAGLEQDLPEATRDLLEDPSHSLYVSPVSIWETAIKVSIGKLNLPMRIVQIFELQAQVNNIQLLSLKLLHLDLIETLPVHHKDPFDRLLAAQALTEQFHFVSTDGIFDQYGVQRLWLK